jgi:putative restriction endonuclease
LEWWDEPIERTKSGVLPYISAPRHVTLWTEDSVREEMFAFLDRLVGESRDGTLSSIDINSFTLHGQQLRLILQTGIRKPADLSAALTISTTYTRPTAARPYEDDVGADGLVRYKYRIGGPQQSDNRAMRVAMERRLPLAYFVGVAPGRYVARYPVWVVAEDVLGQEFSIAVDEGQRFVDLAHLEEPQRAYIERLTRARLHQPLFRAQVLHAYESRCAMCRLHHPPLLDAAHIIPDGQPRGEPVVPNGLALCKIHHAAYDVNILGVRPDLVIEVAPEILREIDGPMLRHGLQEMAGRQLQIPRERAAQPDKERLRTRYEQFRQVS